MPEQATQEFRAARDFLLTHRDDYQAACSGFHWPRLERFNWALDWFDRIASGERRNQAALWVVYEDGRETRLSFTELSGRSSRIANYLRGLGAPRLISRKLKALRRKRILSRMSCSRPLPCPNQSKTEDSNRLE